MGGVKIVHSFVIPLRQLTFFNSNPLFTMLLSSSPFAWVAAAGTAVLLIFIAIIVFMIIVQWRIFSKAGRPGWAIFIPIYNLIVQLQVAKLSPWLVFIYLAALIPVVGSIAVFVFNIIVTVKVGIAYNKSAGFIVGMILLPIIFLPILAFGNSQYKFDEVRA